MPSSTDDVVDAVPDQPSAFEVRLAELSLPPLPHDEREALDAHAACEPLREWAARNANKRFMPEALLQAWNIRLDKSWNE